MQQQELNVSFWYFSVCEKVTINYPSPLTESTTTKTSSKHAGKVRYQAKKYVLDTTCQNLRQRWQQKESTWKVPPSPFIKGMGLIYTIKLILNFSQGADLSPQEVPRNYHLNYLSFNAELQMHVGTTLLTQEYLAPSHQLPIAP